MSFNGTGRYIKVFPTTAVERKNFQENPSALRTIKTSPNHTAGNGGRYNNHMEEDGWSYRWGPRGGYIGGPRGIGENKIYMSNLPLGANKEDVVGFFSPTVPQTICIHMGRAEVVFRTAEDAHLAMKKNNEYCLCRKMELSMEPPSRAVGRSNGPRRRGGMGS